MEFFCFLYFKFTIQNVSIKFKAILAQSLTLGNLQYKMFLLNHHEISEIPENFRIYNTKCFY